MYIQLWPENVKEKDYLRDLVVDGNTIKIQEIWCEVTELINFIHDEDQWRALVYAVMNLRVSGRRGISRQSG